MSSISLLLFLCNVKYVVDYIQCIFQLRHSSFLVLLNNPIDEINCNHFPDHSSSSNITFLLLPSPLASSSLYVFPIFKFKYAYMGLFFIFSYLPKPSSFFYPTSVLQGRGTGEKETETGQLSHFHVKNESSSINESSVIVQFELFFYLTCLYF